MTIRSFWTIFIKILGLWLVFDSISVFPQFISTLLYLNFDDSNLNYLLSIAFLLIVVGIYFFILRLFVFKTSWLIDKLHLDKGFVEEKIELNIRHSTVLSIATIVIGGLMFIDGLPTLCKEVFEFFQQKNVFRQDPDSAWVIFSLAKTLIGYLLMTNSHFIVILVEKQINKKTIE